MATVAEAPRLRAAGGARTRGGYRPDVQGLRALAVLIVVLDHAQLGPFSGGYLGVDVFFVLSGFLISGLLYAEVDRTGRVSLLDFYARRARRILPAATVVLAATVAVSYLVLDGIAMLRLLKDSVWAAFFAVNVSFARAETDYWSQGEAVSPIQHFWSLAVEEQFYLLWPLLLLLVVRRGARGRPGLDRRAVGVTVGVLLVASLAWALWTTAASPHSAYFSSLARAWELACGAAAALVVRGRLPLTGRGRAVLSCAGLTLVAAAALLYDEGTGVPGLPTVVPVLGTAMLLVAGADGTGVTQRVLGSAPLRWVGDRSYSLYLWHWPALVLAAAALGPLSVLEAVVVVLLAVGLSDVSYRLVEDPFRRTRRLRGRWRGIALYPASVAALAAVVLLAHAGVVNQFSAQRPAVSLQNFGQGGGDEDPPTTFSADPRVALVQASVLAARNDMPVPSPLRPAALGLADHVAADLGDCEYWGLPDPMPLCPRGDPDGDRTLVVVGDSHSRHWIPAVEPLAQRYGYRAYYFVLQGCTPALVQPWSPLKDAPDEDCAFFHEWSQEQVERLRPDLVLMSTDQQPSYLDADGERVTSHEGVAQLIEAGIAARVKALRPVADRVVVIGDPPRLSFDPQTVLGRGATLADGLSDPFPRSMLMRRAVRAGALAGGAEYVETKQWFCAYGQCPVVVGDYITRRDRGHMTLEYAASLSEPLGARLGLSRRLP